MKESSLKNASFKKVSFSQVRALVDVLAGNAGHDRSYLQEKYERSAGSFAETYRFIQVLDLTEEKAGRLSLSVAPETHGIRSLLLESLFRRADRIPALVAYLKNYSAAEDTYVFKPTVRGNLQTSDIRNFLLELDFLDYTESTGVYSITRVGLPYFEAFIRRTSAAQLDKILRQKEKFGLKAELTILKYEKKRLAKFPKLSKSIAHTSRFNTRAGYDIQSVTVINGETTEPRYIEVKAVSGETFDFYWTINEVEVAKKFGKQYHLYLLPVSKGGSFDAKRLKIIVDPYESIYKKKEVKALEPVLFHIVP